MFAKKPLPREIEKLDEAIEALHSELAGFEGHEEEYDKTSDQLVKLLKLRKELLPSNRVSSDTLAVVGANLLGIAMIISYERVNVLTSKALGLVTRMR